MVQRSAWCPGCAMEALTAALWWSDANRTTKDTVAIFKPGHTALTRFAENRGFTWQGYALYDGDGNVVVKRVKPVPEFRI